MLRTVLTLALTIGALALALTPHGSEMLGSNRPMLVIALAVLGVLQGYRVFTAWQAQRHGDRVKKIPKRPLGI